MHNVYYCGKRQRTGNAAASGRRMYSKSTTTTMMMMMVPIFGTFPPSFADDDDAHTCALSFVIPPSSLFNKIKSIAFTALSRRWVGMQEAGGNEGKRLRVDARWTEVASYDSISSHTLEKVTYIQFPL